jgi:eukaryotic-like serine/threonine-protein kinase
MLSDQNYSKILNYFDRQFWEGKTTETNWNYYGLVLDRYFDNSVLSIEYLDITDFFECNGGFSFVDDKYLSEQYENIPINKRLSLLQNIFNILKHSTINKDQSNYMIETVSNVLKRNNVKVMNPDTGYITIMPDDILDSGSYCNIVRVADGILRKELKSIYKNDVKLSKRLKYEFENMQKLADCSQILSVFDFNPENNSYLMEQGDKNLYKYLEDEIELTFDSKLKIVMDVLNGMSFAHEHSIIHRDLHLGNVLKIGNDFVICDFGLSKDLSIERSMKSSYTEKNNHLFVDPLAISDFTKLDLKSDIYSIGKIIDYVFTYNTPNPNHIFKTVVERCICRDKALRYDSIKQIISEIEVILKSQGQEESRQNAINKILNEQYDTQVHEFILDLVNTDRLSKFIVTHKLSSFGEIVMKFESVYQAKILHSISLGYAEATGYGGWRNYDIFARLAYDLCLNLKDTEVKRIAKSILEECANIRHEAKDLLERLHN